LGAGGAGWEGRAALGGAGWHRWCCCLCLCLNGAAGGAAEDDWPGRAGVAPGLRLCMGRGGRAGVRVAGAAAAPWARRGLAQPCAGVMQQPAACSCVSAPQGPPWPPTRGASRHPPPLPRCRTASSAGTAWRTCCRRAPRAATLTAASCGCWPSGCCPQARRACGSPSPSSWPRWWDPGPVAPAGAQHCWRPCSPALPPAAAPAAAPFASQPLGLAPRLATPGAAAPQAPESGCARTSAAAAACAVAR
jgi:hypothetical protein